MITVYLYEQDGMLVPEWVAYASHDYHGDDLRRRWDDHGELDMIDGHPVVFAGAGSHASYFRPGEYQATVGLPVPERLRRVTKAWHKFWSETLGQAGGVGENPFRIPFVDYARGDGLSIGPGQDKEWTIVLIDEATPWAGRYRGLWGLFARDPVSGENAPAGPMYNRDGSPRASWYDPVGFAGLEKVPPPPEELRLLDERCAQISQRQAELGAEISLTATGVQDLGTELKAMEGNPHLARQYAALGKKLGEEAAELRKLRCEHSENTALLEGVDRRLRSLSAGDKDDPRAHIRRLAAPVSTAQMRFNRLAETWAAVSLSVLLLAFVGLMIFAPQHLWVGAAVLVIAFIVLESILRGTFTSTVTTITVVLAVISTLVLILGLWKYIIVGGLIGAAIFLLVQKIRELRD